MKPLDGWGRIGLVIWAAGLIWLVFWQWTEPSRYLEGLMSRCDVYLSHSPSQISDTQGYGQCLDRSVALTHTQYAEARSGSGFAVSVVVAAIYAFLGLWLPYTLVVTTVRWIAKGF
jgi:hypothetical protein